MEKHNKSMSCSVLEHDLERFEKELKEVKKLLSEVMKEISTNKEKYMPAVALITKLNSTIESLEKNIHDIHIHMSTEISRLDASTQSSHKRLDQANDIVSDLVKLPEIIRRDNFRFLGAISFVVISFGVWVTQSLNETDIKLAVNTIEIQSLKTSIKENSLNISKTYRAISEHNNDK